MVDCGTVAFEPLQIAKNSGLDIIVIDHHLGVLEKPSAIAVINPNLLNEKFPHKNLCAAGVVFLFLVAVNKTLREMNFFNQINEPNLMDLIDLVALGTTCDVMPLTGLNRAFVTSGLKILQQRKNLGIKIISDFAKINSAINSYTLGFIIGPRINAGGRVGNSSLGATILSSDDELVCHEIAEKLEKLNQDRKDIEIAVINQAIENLEKELNGFSKNDAVIFAISRDWHQGVIGIVASRLKEQYNKPVAVITIDSQTNLAKASCRSITGIDFGNEILKARLAGLIKEGGGHAMAGGFSMPADKIKELHQFFCQNLNEKVNKILQENLHEYDLACDLSQLNLNLIKELSKLEPFGSGNPRPRFLIRNLNKIKANFVGKEQEHLSIIFSNQGLTGFNNQISAILFKANISKLTPIITQLKTSQTIDIIGTIDINNWLGIEKLQIQIEDIIL
jgi:single-stranded-DNA-specific exonuclease